MIYRIAAAVAVFVLAFLPVSYWVTGRRVTEAYWLDVDAWVNGTVLCLLGGAVLGGVLFLLLRRRTPPIEDRLETFLGRWEIAVVGALGFAALLAYAVVSQTVFDGLALHVDALTQAFQAQTFASGRLWRPSPPQPEFFSAFLIADVDGKVFAQFPPGWAAMMAVGELIGLRWLVAPVCAALGAVAFYLLLKGVGESRLTALAGMVLLAFAPWFLFNAGTQMNHVPTVALLLAGAAALLSGLNVERYTVRVLFLSGVLFGAAATIRPVDALAFLLPAGVWLLYRVVRAPNRWRHLAGFAGGVFVPGVLFLLYNWQTTGGPFTLGYTALWGAEHGLGFHDAPWGAPHTPARGLSLVNQYLLNMQAVLYESPFPALLPAVVAFLLAPRLKAADRYLLASGALLWFAYFAYWHDARYLGPRFFLPLAPIAVLWTVRLPEVFRQRFQSRVAAVVALAVLCIGLVHAYVARVSERAVEYGQLYENRRIDPDSVAEVNDIKDALIFVPSTWGSMVTARMWALGISRKDADRFYWSIDLCALETAVRSLELTGADGQTAIATLERLTGDSARLVASTVSPDTTARMLPGKSYSARCVSRLAGESRGTWSILPFLLARENGNLFARDVRERNTALVNRYENRPVYLYRLPAVDPDRPSTDNEELGQPRFYRIDADSAVFSWRRSMALP